MLQRSVWQRSHDAALLYADLTRRCAQTGLELEIRTDFSELADCYQKAVGRRVFPVFDPTTSDISRQNSFWIAGLLDGEIVHTQALRFWDLADGSLAEHLIEHARLYCALGDNRIDPERTEVRSENLARLSGRICYHGQIWLDKRLRGQEVGGFPLGRELLPRIGILAAVLGGRPDAIFGLAPYPTAEKGILASYGMYHAELGALAFYDETDELQWHETVVWSAVPDQDQEIQRTIERSRLYTAAERKIRVEQMRQSVRVVRPSEQ